MRPLIAVSITGETLGQFEQDMQDAIYRHADILELRVDCLGKELNEAALESLIKGYNIPKILTVRNIEEAGPNT